jgi:hypothetical protein
MCDNDIYDCVCEDRYGKVAPSSCTVDSIVVPRQLWERTVRVIETIYNGRRGSCGAIENVYCPPMMNRHGIDNLMNEIRRHNMTITNSEANRILTNSEANMTITNSAANAEHHARPERSERT